MTANPLVIFLIVWLTAFFGSSWALLVGHWLGFSSFSYGQGIIGELLPLAYGGGHIVHGIHHGRNRCQVEPMRRDARRLGHDVPGRGRDRRSGSDYNGSGPARGGQRASGEQVNSGFDCWNWNAQSAPRPPGQARPGRTRPWGESHRPRPAGRRHGGGLSGDARDCRPGSGGGGAGGCGRGLASASCRERICG